MRLLLVTPDLDHNSLGRTYCLWLLAQAAGWDARVVAPRGARIWAPLDGTPFAAVCSALPEPAAPALAKLLPGTDLVIAVKPLPPSFGLARKAADRAGVPVMVDIDDPDLEAVRARRTPVKRAAKWMLKPRTMAQAARLHRHALRVPRIVSNPYLQRIYGGAVIPHVREPSAAPHVHTSAEPSVVFVGTNRAHKGVDVLRAAVAAAAGAGVMLTVTDRAPADARPWERWVGQTSFAEGLRLVESADIVVIPSLRTTWSIGQLPAKLVDGMMAGAAVVVSDVEPLGWAVGAGGLLVEPGSVPQLAAALTRLTDPAERSRLGAAAHRRALELFTVHANVETFVGACRAAAETR
ncbi:glycosyltransferase family 4 protein [Naasia sp. SYSU D00948]|uniref:glycosyltransferase family 4 protein n=1 Tax=Naasia sp. SYSU D00948 TaxID=2817379 RepID=UPI001B30AC1E|nr:glycosyltransferase family 4 protein [Naasia sp. SYSU D00948]